MKSLNVRLFCNGLWALLMFVTSYSSGQNITALEYYFDIDPGYNNGTVVPINPTSDTTNVQLTVNSIVSRGVAKKGTLENIIRLAGFIYIDLQLFICRFLL